MWIYKRSLLSLIYIMKKYLIHMGCLSFKGPFCNSKLKDFNWTDKHIEAEVLSICRRSGFIFKFMCVFTFITTKWRETDEVWLCWIFKSLQELQNRWCDPDKTKPNLCVLHLTFVLSGHSDSERCGSWWTSEWTSLPVLSDRRGCWEPQLHPQRQQR